jgi:LysR family transcriptional regulator, benzoate and cis,cis-muconate-responsive activator of ben and cat genes
MRTRHAGNLRAAGREVKHRLECDLHSRDVDADLRLLRYFVAVAEELNFTRAAARLHMAQQPLSAAIRRFEADLGAELFRRTTRQVELTDAGRALLEPARAALLAADDALAAARAAGRGVAGDLRLGLSLGARYGLEPLFAALAEQHPALHLHVRHDSAAPLVADLQQGRLDIAVTFAAQIPGDLQHERLVDEPAVLAVAATHPLADRRAVALADLRDETFALDVPGDNPDYDSAVVEACRRSGFEPRTRASSPIHDAWEGLIRSKGCVGLTAVTCGPAAHRDLRLLRVDEPLTFPLDLVWREQTGPPRPALEAVIATARQVRHERGRG